MENWHTGSCGPVCVFKTCTTSLWENECDTGVALPADKRRPFPHLSFHTCQGGEPNNNLSKQEPPLAQLAKCCKKREFTQENIVVPSLNSVNPYICFN